MDQILSGAAANVTSQNAKGFFQEIKRHIRYVFICKKNVEKFEKKMEFLIATRKGVQQEVDAAQRNMKTIKADVELRCKRVDETISEERKKVNDFKDKANVKCFLGLCPNIKSRYLLSRKAEKDVAAVDELLQQGRFDKVAVRDVPEAPVCGASTNFESFDSRKEAFDEIMETLKDPTIIMIGVYGPGGVGKTTLVDELARQVKEVTSFDTVVKATVTQTPNIEKIQYELAEPLGLKLKEKSIQVRALWLSKRLKKEKKILVILDNIWAGLDLKEVGIPFGDQHKGCKILLISREKNVLTNEMEAKRTFEIGVLKEEEAWELFKKIAETDFESPELLFVATEVAKRCGGLPLAIVTDARAFRNKDIYTWEDASLQLQRPSPRNFTGIPADSAIELSNKNIESKELRQAFSLSCLLGHINDLLQNLLRCAMGLRLFDGVKKVEATRNTVSTKVSRLKSFCLFLEVMTIIVSLCVIWFMIWPSNCLYGQPCIREFLKISQMKRECKGSK